MEFSGTGHLDSDDYWDGKKIDRAQEDLDAVRLNPHQFGDQLTLFHAPLNQPESGLTKGNPNARLYRTLQVPNHLQSPEDVLKFASQPGSDRGHSRSLGIHWSHRLDETSDLSHEVVNGNWGRHGDDSRAVILEADHPGLDHTIDVTTHPKDRPEGLKFSGALNDKLPDGPKKDWSIIHETVGPHEQNEIMLPEVPVRPGAPMSVHAVHMPDESGSFIRNPVQFKGHA